MPCNLTLAQLAQVLNSETRHLGDNDQKTVANGITTDTRSIKHSEVFVALRGTQFDGHQFASAALEKGAIALIVDYELPLNVPQFVVKDTLKAYQDIANWWRQQFNIPIIAVTGSVGKTTTKELIAAVLATQGQVLKTYANYNNEIGVPKTLLELGPEHDFAVIEMAMRGTGQIALLAQIAQPTIGIITNVGTAHIELLGSEQAIANAKCELLAEMPKDSVAILNADNQRLIATAANCWQGETITYGLEAGSLRGKLIDDRTLLVDGLKFSVPLAGRHNALNYLAALAIAKVVQISWESLQDGLTVSMPEGRSQRYELGNDIIILDETYNAGLESMLAALQMLAETPGKRHIAVLGTMKELGDFSLDFHRQVGEKVQQLKLDGLFIFADAAEAEAMAAGAGNISQIETLQATPENRQVLVEKLQAFVKSGDRLLFKASHSVALDRILQQFRTEFTNVN